MGIGVSEWGRSVGSSKSQADVGDDDLLAFQGTLEVELLNGAEFALASEPRMAKGAWQCLSRWPHAAWQSKERSWKFPAQHFLEVRERLLGLTSRGARCTV